MRGAARTRRGDAQVSARDLVTEYDKRHGPHADLWMLGEFIVGVVRVAWWCCGSSPGSRSSPIVVALLGYGYWEFGQLGPALVCGVLLAGSVVVAGGRRRLVQRVRDVAGVVELAGLAHLRPPLGLRHDHGRPRAAATWATTTCRSSCMARCRPDVDKLTVQLLQGQHPDDFAARRPTPSPTPSG